MENEFESAYRAAQRAYELGRLRTAGFRAVLVTAVVTAIAVIAVGQRGLPWLPLTLLVWAFIEWRGAWLLRGGRRGLIAGVAALVLPLSILRPCCRPGVDMSSGDCCPMPSACVAVGILLGLSLAILVPRAPREYRVTTALGMALGVGSVAALRCGALFFGEAAGLMGGLVGGVLAANLARAWLDRAKTKSA